MIQAVETERLYLRRLHEDDLDVYYQRIYADPEVMKTLPSGAPISRHNFDLRIPVFMIDHWTQHGFGPWVAFHKADQIVIGHCGLKYWPESTEVEVFYALDRRYWGQGLATEGAGASLRFGFEALHCDQIIAGALSWNRASCRVLEKLGMQAEGEMTLGNLSVVRYRIDRSLYDPGDAHLYIGHEDSDL